jgi:hypothetical protein
MVSAVPTFMKICINQTHQNKTLHLFVEINNYVVEGLVDTRTSMSVMDVVVVKKLGIMHSVTRFETYKTASRVVTQALGRIDEVPIKVGRVQCTFIVVDINSYDVLLGLDFLIKISAIVDVETKPNPSKAWSRGQCGSVAIDYAKSITENEFRNSNARCYYYLEKHTYQ